MPGRVAEWNSAGGSMARSYAVSIVGFTTGVRQRDAYLIAFEGAPLVKPPAL